MKTYYPSVVISLTLATATATASAFAAPPTAASIETALTLNTSQKTVETTLAGTDAKVRLEMQKAIAAQNAVNSPGNVLLTTQQQNAVNLASPKITAILKEDLSWAKLQPQFLKIYQNNLSQSEVDQLITLYKTPGFLDLMKKMQQIDQKTAQVIVQSMPNIIKKVEPIVGKAIEDAKVK